MAFSKIVGYFLATLAPTYATPPTTGGCVVFISGYTASTLNSTVTDTFGPIIVPAGGCVFTGMTTNELKQLHAVAIRPGYNNVTGFYITGETINPSLRKVAATTINLLTGAATETSSSKKCPTYEDVGEYASKAGATVSLTSSQALRCYPKTYYPLFGSTMYTSAVYTNQVPVYSKLYYGCSSNVLSGCSSNDSTICKLDGVICVSDEVICVSDGVICVSDGDTCTCNTKEYETPTLKQSGKVTLEIISRIVSSDTSSDEFTNIGMNFSTDGQFTGVTSTSIIISVANGSTTFSTTVGKRSTTDIIMCYKDATYITVTATKSLSTSLIGRGTINAKGTTSQTATCNIGGSTGSYTFTLT